jgi:superfamily II DNA helicase RecQ
MDAETCQRAIEQLSVHGGAVRDSYTGEVRAGPEERWAPEYERQRALRKGELEEVAAFATGAGCRMSTVVEHFGDRARGPCGVCDSCSPELAVARDFRRPTDDELGVLRSVLDGVAAQGLEADGVAVDRRGLDRVLGALEAGGLIGSERRTFEKNGDTISYTRVRLLAEGRRADDITLGGLWLDGELVTTASAPRKRTSRKSSAGSSGRTLDEIVEDAGDLDPALIDRLRSWRAREAKARAVPAYRVMTNRALTEVARMRPEDAEQLGQVHGVGAAFLKRYAEDVLRLLADA